MVFLIMPSKDKQQNWSKMFILLKVVSSAVQIFYLQETPIVSSPSVLPSTTIASLAPSFTSSAQYAWSAWFYKTAWYDWGIVFRVALDTRYRTL